MANETAPHEDSALERDGGADAWERPARELELPTRVANALKTAYAQRCRLRGAQRVSDSRLTEGGGVLQSGDVRPNDTWKNSLPFREGETGKGPYRKRAYGKRRTFPGAFLTPKSMASGQLSAGELAQDVRQHGEAFRRLHGIGEQGYEKLLEALYDVLDP